MVAIKQMDLPPFREAEGEREFRVEVDILSRLDHPNLVPLIGYCADGKQRFLVYEFMHKGNLQDLLNGWQNFSFLVDIVLVCKSLIQSIFFMGFSYMSFTIQYLYFVGIAETKMDWPLRLKVAFEAAKGLAYLHSSSAVGIPVIHRDFKSTNILLGANFEAKVKNNLIFALLLKDGPNLRVLC